MGSHLHKFKVDSETSNNHVHNLIGCTENMIGINSFHFHHYYGISSYTNHTHYYSGITGYPIKTDNGHIHKLEGFLEFNNTHEHKFCDYTFEDLEYISNKLSNEAYI